MSLTVENVVAHIVAAALWTHEAIKVSVELLFRLSSGNCTPLYVNGRRLISAPATRDLVTAFAHHLYHDRADCIAAGETAVRRLARRAPEQAFRVRPEDAEAPRDGGRIEGIGRGVILLFEDLITDGRSKMSFIDVIREAGCTIGHCLAVVDREKGGRAALENIGVTLHSRTPPVSRPVAPPASSGATSCRK